MMWCKCGSWMIWHSDYVHGVFVSWYVCPRCGYDTRNIQYIWSDHTEMRGDIDADSY